MSNFNNPQGFDIQPAPPAAKSGGGCLKWLIPIGCLGAFLVCGGIIGSIWLGFSFMKNLPPYKTAVETAQNSAEVQEILGDNIQPEWAVQASTNVDGNDAFMELTIPLTGSNGSGQVHVRARSSDNDNWQYEELYFTSSSGEKVDLLHHVDHAEVESTPEEGGHEVPDFSDT